MSVGQSFKNIFGMASLSECGVMLSCVLSLCLFNVNGVGAQPVFPDGVAPLLTSIGQRVAAASKSEGPDDAVVGALVEESRRSLERDLLDDATKSELAEVAYRRVHARLQKYVYTGGCPRDWRDCPLGWQGSAGMCTPPPAYDGLCGSFSVEQMSLKSKEDMAWKCRMEWPCSPICHRDYSRCPKGWRVDGRLCLADTVYQGICSPAMDFADWPARQRAQWAVDCEAEWPCVESVSLPGDGQVRDGPV